MSTWYTLQRPTVPSHLLRLTTGLSGPVNGSRFRQIGTAIIESFPPNWKTDGLWKGYVDGVHRHIPQMVADANPIALCTFFAGLQKNNLGNGIGWSHKYWTAYNEDAEYRKLARAGLMDLLCSLAALVGVEDLENPEAGDTGTMAALDGDALIGRVDGHFGYELRSSSAFAQNIGIVRSNGAVCDNRTLLAAATSERLIWLLRQSGVAPADAHILEIGGGVGNLALHCLRRGVGRYTIVDLPTMRAIQTYVAMSEFPDMAIGFNAPTERLNLLTPDGIEAVAPRTVHLVVNEDSLPEMTEETGRQYARQIARICTGRFLSLNHESRHRIGDHRHTRVGDLCRGVLTPEWRALHWMRRGYVEEVFRPPT